MLTKDQARVTASVTPRLAECDGERSRRPYVHYGGDSRRPVDEKRRPPPCNGEQFLPVPEGDEPG